MAGQRTCVLLLPECDDPATFFSIDVARSGREFVAEDIAPLVDTFHEALATLPGYTLEWEDQWVIGSLIHLQ